MDTVEASTLGLLFSLPTIAEDNFGSFTVIETTPQPVFCLLLKTFLRLKGASVLGNCCSKAAATMVSGFKDVLEWSILGAVERLFN